MDPQERAGDSHAVDIASLAQELMKELEASSSSETQLGGPILIAKVGDTVRNQDAEEYDPHHVSIGPYHRNNGLTRDEEKRSSLRAVLSAASPNVTVEVFVEELKRLKDQATRCYRQHHKIMGISNKDFVRMLLLDACYLLARFGGIREYAGGRRKNNESTVSANGQVQEEYQEMLPASSGVALEDVEVVQEEYQQVLPASSVDALEDVEVVQEEYQEVLPASSGDALEDVEVVQGEYQVVLPASRGDALEDVEVVQEEYQEVLSASSGDALEDVEVVQEEYQEVLPASSGDALEDVEVVQEEYQEEFPATSGDALEDVEVVRDVFYLAENQLPFFVIERIYQLSNLEGSTSAAEAISTYIRELLGDRGYSLATPNVVEPPGPGNLLHLMHMHFKPTAVPASSTVSTATDKSMGRWRTATDYYFFAGVNFKKRLVRQGECMSILDVRLVDGGGTLEIPFLKINGDTWGILRNLIALEQHNSNTTGSYVTAYCIFMSQLSCTESDVELLSRRGVISHTCGNHSEVGGFFTKLCKGVVVRKEDDDTNYLKATWQALEKRFQNRGRRWMAWLRHKYFRNPWVTVGLAATAVALACEVVQAVYSVLEYKS